MRRFLALAAAAALGLTGCTGDGGNGQEDDGVTVLAAFYPLQYAAEQVGGPGVTVESLTPPGTEPHDVELSAQQVAAVSQADLVLYIKGFQPAVDEAVAQQAGDRAVDVSAGIDMLPGAGGGTDPHIWLNPINMISVADIIADRLAQADPGATDEFQGNAADLAGRLDALDREWRAGTETCANRYLVVSHEAFGYLADRYGFTQVGVSGLSPEAEPDPSDVAEVADFVRAEDVKTIYYETLVDPKVAETVAAETGATVAVLDPLEGLPEGSTEDYLSVMRANLATVAAGQPCS